MLDAGLSRISRSGRHLTEVSGRTLGSKTSVGAGVGWAMPTDGEPPRPGSVGEAHPTTRRWESREVISVPFLRATADTPRSASIRVNEGACIQLDRMPVNAARRGCP